MRKCVVFLYAHVHDANRPAGTAFFAGLSVDDSHPDRGTAGFLLTANHVIAACRAKGDGSVHIRLNLIGGGSTWHESHCDDWEQPDPEIDVAIYRWTPLVTDHIDMRAWLLTDNVATDIVMRNEGIDIGDEVFTVGLFRNHLGTDQNEPILRVGNLAARPVDMIYSPKFGRLRAILVEARSIGGLSGSPVFVHMGVARFVDRKAVLAGNPEPFLLLGIMHGHWEISSALADEVGVVDDNHGDESIHTGMAIVIPAQQLMEVVGTHMEGIMKALRKQLDEPSGVVADDALSSSDSTADLTGRLLQVPKDEADEVHREHDQ
jgi:hypothetical protein